MKVEEAILVAIKIFQRIIVEEMLKVISAALNKKPQTNSSLELDKEEIIRNSSTTALNFQ